MGGEILAVKQATHHTEVRRETNDLSLSSRSDILHHQSPAVEATLEMNKLI